MSHLALAPVSEAVYAALLADTTLVAAATGGIFGDIPQATAMPVVWFELLGERESRGFGTGSLPEIELRVHAYSNVESPAEAETLARLAINALRDVALTVTGYRQAGRVTYRNTIKLPYEELNGAKVCEVVAFFTVWVEEV